jgi:hypothetical protein
MVRRIAVVVLLGLLAAQGFALPLAFDPSARIWGADLGVGYTGLKLLPDRTTTLWAYGGGGWERMTYWRYSDGAIIGSYFDPLTGAVVTTPVPSGTDPDLDPYHQRAEAKWQLGVMQGLTTNERIGKDGLSAFVFYRGRYDGYYATSGSPMTLLSASGFPDASFLNSVFAGFKWNDVLLDSHHVQSGVAAEVSAEAGISGGSFLRLNATGRLFVPIFDLDPSADRNRLNLYLGDFLSVDWMTGASIPLVIRQSFGGLDPRVGLGGAVRGVDSGSLDANLKAVNNLELRLSGPALFTPIIVPGIVAYVDAGWFDQVGEAVADPAMGFVASTGGGVFVNFFDFAQLFLYLNYRLIGTNANGDRLTTGVSGLDFTFKF